MKKEGDSMVIVIPAIVALLVAAIAVAAVITIAFLTAPKLKKLIRERKEKKKKAEVAFGKTKEIVRNNLGEILKNAPKMTPEELDRISDETPYFVVDYDLETDEASDFTFIKTDGTDEKIESILSQSDNGIILFD